MDTDMATPTDGSVGAGGWGLTSGADGMHDYGDAMLTRCIDEGWMMTMIMAFFSYLVMLLCFLYSLLSCWRWRLGRRSGLLAFFIPLACFPPCGWMALSVWLMGWRCPLLMIQSIVFWSIWQFLGVSFCLGDRVRLSVYLSVPAWWRQRFYLTCCAATLADTVLME